MSDRTIKARSKHGAKLAAMELGATHYHTAYYPRDSRAAGRPFAFHFFKDGKEIAHYLLGPEGGPIHEFVTVLQEPREWGIPHDLKEISVQEHLS